MELSSVVHYMNESFAYKLNNHEYLIKLKTKRNAFDKVTLRYLEKYFREMNVKNHQVYSKEMTKVAVTNLHDYYEVIIDDRFEFNNNEMIMLAIRYCFLLEKDGEKIYYGNYKFFNEEPYDTIDFFNLVIHQADCSYFDVPEWSKGAVVYQIFPERFAPTNDNYSSNWLTCYKEKNGRSNGTLLGIAEKIDYLKELGIDAIYLNPIFLANTSHRYDTVDYLKVDPLLGDEKDLKKLVDTCHKNNIKVILDLVFNHTSTYFFAFEDILKNQEKSKYKDWYLIRKFPVSRTQQPPNYMSFSFGAFMPKLNTDNPECRKYLIDVAKHYVINFDVDGYRLDVADEVTHSFWKEMRKEVKQIKKDCLIMGEVWYESTPYLRGDEFDSVMNYTIYDSIRKFLKEEINQEKFIDMISRERGETEINYYHSSNILIGSHDTNRIFNAVNFDENKFNLAMALLLFLPGSPIIYYGDEIMFDGDNPGEARRGMIFDADYKKETKEMVKKLIALKHQPVIKIGDISFDQSEDGLLVINRFIGEEKIMMIVCLDEEKDLSKFYGRYDLINQTNFKKKLKKYEFVILK